MKKLILLISFIVLGITTQATVHVVSSKNNSGTGTLRSKIATAVSGDTIRFNPNLIANGSDSIVLNSEIAFSKSLTITGLYTPTDTLFLSGGGTNRMFRVDTTTFVVFDSLVLRNGFDVFDGGAVFAQNVDSAVVKNLLLHLKFLMLMELFMVLKISGLLEGLRSLQFLLLVGVL